MRERWREMLGDFPAIRQVFHVLCAMGDGEDATDVLYFAARQDWMRDLARRFEITLSRFEDTMAYEPEDDGLAETLRQLYAAGRVRANASRTSGSPHTPLVVALAGAMVALLSSRAPRAREPR